MLTAKTAKNNKPLFSFC